MEVLLMIADILWSFFIIFPLCVLFWSGSWRVLELCVLPNDLMMQRITCYTLGCFAHMIVYFLLPACANCIHFTELHSVKHFITSKVILYLDAWAMLSIWYGTWMIADNLIGISNTLYPALTLLVLIIILAILRGFGAALSTPMALELDNRADFYTSYPRFRTQPSSLLFVLDCAVTVFLFRPLPVLFWWSLWNLADLYILPNDKLMSYITCIAVGFTSATILHCTITPIRLLSIKISGSGSGCWHGVIDSTYKALGAMTCLSLWRGLWGIMKDYVLSTDNASLLAWLFHGLSIASLCAIQTISTISAPVYPVDAEGGPTKSLQSRIRYFQEWYRLRQGDSQSTNVTIQQDISEVEDQRIPDTAVSPAQNYGTCKIQADADR